MRTFSHAVTYWVVDPWSRLTLAGRKVLVTGAQGQSSGTCVARADASL